MIALPAAPAPAPRRQLIVGTALASAAAATLIGGMLGLWLRFREHAHDTGVRWVPRGVRIPEVTSNVMLIGFLPLLAFAQWAVYAARRNDKHHTALALGLVALLGIALINAQANIYTQMDLALSDGPYAPMFYALTGVFMVLLVIGVGFSAITAFRFLGGRTTEREIVAAHAIYWYALSVLFFALWLVVYVTK
jgi:cytochrome c oxidase subunit III